MMEFNQIAKQTIDFQKTAFNSWFDAAVMVQDQAASTMETMMNQGNLVPAEGRKTIKSLADACKEERNRFKSYVEAGFAGLEKHFVKENKNASAKTSAKN